MMIKGNSSFLKTAELLNSSPPRVAGQRHTQNLGFLIARNISDSGARKDFIGRAMSPGGEVNGSNTGYLVTR